MAHFGFCRWVGNHKNLNEAGIALDKVCLSISNAIDKTMSSVLQKGILDGEIASLDLDTISKPFEPMMGGMRAPKPESKVIGFNGDKIIFATLETLQGDGVKIPIVEEVVINDITVREVDALTNPARDEEDTELLLKVFDTAESGLERLKSESLRIYDNIDRLVEAAEKANKEENEKTISLNKNKANNILKTLQGMRSMTFAINKSMNSYCEGLVAMANELQSKSNNSNEETAATPESTSQETTTDVKPEDQL